RDVVEALLDRDIQDRSSFEDQAVVEGLVAQLTTPLRDVTIVRDEEHNCWTLRLDDRSTGYSRVSLVGAEFVLSGEYRALQSSYAEVRDFIRGFAKGPVEIRTVGAEPLDAEPAGGADAGDEVEGEAPAAAAAPGGRKAAEPVGVRTVDEMVEHFLALGRKGVAINRYKGLGEMNPDTLWATT